MLNNVKSVERIIFLINMFILQHILPPLGTSHITPPKPATPLFRKAVANSDYDLFVISARPSVVLEQRDFHLIEFHDISNSGFSLKYVDIFRFCFKSDKNIRPYT